MANDCLVTKLKAVVNNPALRTLGDFELSAKVTDSETPIFLNVSCGGNTGFTVSSYPAGKVTEVQSFSIYKSFRLGTGEYKIRILPDADKQISHIMLRQNAVDGSTYNCSYDNYVLINTEEVKYLPYSFFISGIPFNGELADLYKFTDISFVITGSEMVSNGALKLSGTFSDLNPDIEKLSIQQAADYIIDDIANVNLLSHMKNLKLFNSSSGASNMGVYGDIGDVENVNLENILLKNNGVTGNLEDFVRTQIAHGRDYNDSDKSWLNFYLKNDILLNSQQPTTPRYIYIHFTSTGATITESNKTTVIATYNASNNTWTYA